MPLTLRPTGLSSPAYRDWLDYVIVEDGRDVGRLYEDRHSKARTAVVLGSITVYVNPRLGIITSGRAASLDEAKAEFLTNWQKCGTDSTSSARSSTQAGHGKFAPAYPADGVYCAVPTNIRAAATLWAGMADRNQARRLPGNRPEGGEAGSALQSAWQ